MTVMVKRVLPLTCCLAMGVSLAAEPSLAVERLEGEVWLSRPGCDAFVLKSRSGLALIVERDYYAVYEGDLVRATPTGSSDLQIEIRGETTIRAALGDTGQDIEPLRIRLDGRCDERRTASPGTSNRAGHPALAGHCTQRIAELDQAITATQQGAGPALASPRNEPVAMISHSGKRHQERGGPTSSMPSWRQAWARASACSGVGGPDGAGNPSCSAGRPKARMNRSNPSRVIVSIRASADSTL